MGAWTPQNSPQIDVRGPRFSAALTSLVLLVALLTQQPWLLAFQVAVFAVAAIAGLKWSPYGNLFRLAKRTFDLGPPPETEPAAGPRFSQAVGLVFSGAGLAVILAGAPAVGWTLVGVVAVLSALLAITGFCVGCMVFTLLLRARYLLNRGAA